MMRTFTVLIALSLLLSAGTAVADEATASGGTKVNQLPYEKRCPALAGALAIVPGLGQVYNRQYVAGGLLFVAELGLYSAAAAYAGVFENDKRNRLGYEAICLLALAGGLHLFGIFDATLEAVRVNENLDRWSLMMTPAPGGVNVAYQLRF